MSTAQQPKTTTTEQVAREKNLLDKVLDQTVTYQPFMGDKEVSLSVRLVLRMFAVPTKQGHTCTPEQAAIFIRLCEARGLNPFEGDAFIVGYDTRDGAKFNLITAFQALLKRAEIHPEYNGMECGVTLKGKDGLPMDIEGDLVPDDTTLIGGWARVHFKGRAIPTYRRVDLVKFNKGISVWGTNPAGMIVKVAKAAALRESFPTKCGGMYLRDEYGEDDHLIGAEASPRPAPSLQDMTKALQANGNGPKQQTQETSDPEPDFDPATGEMPLDTDESSQVAPPLLDEAQLAFEGAVDTTAVNALETAWRLKLPNDKDAVSNLANEARTRIKGTRGTGSNVRP